MEFSMSAMMAIRFMLQVAAGKIEGVPQPTWCNFVFWHRIVPGPIEKTRRYPPSDDYPGMWVVEREITFYLLDIPVAIVTMEGIRTDGTGKGDASTSWKQSRVRCASCFYISNGQGVAEEWYDVELPVDGYTSFLMPPQAGTR
jgi:hypothetical protein